MTKRHLPNITRRDFLGSTLIGSGAALLGAAAPIHAMGKKGPKGVFTDPWTGFGGVGDYATSNGNTASVMEAAHLIRDGHAPTLAKTAKDTGEVYDVVIVGGGFSGFGAAYQVHKKFGEEKKCLLLDNHAMFGGEARQNEFDVDGYRLYGPQGSNGFLPPRGNTTPSDEVFRTVGMPMEYEFLEPDASRTKVKAPLDSYDTMYWGEKKYDVGHFFDGEWVVNPWQDDLERTPWPDDVRADLIRAYSEKKLSV
ncbi:MAG: hypothetical protein CME48_02860 [Halieaceae bacterium]|nr:hypothetical protein [Halieaceae bacterium]